MAYAAVISLKQTIERSRLETSSAQILEYFYEEVSSLQEVLKELDSSSRAISRERVNDLDGEIRDAVWKLEDVIESHCSNQFLSLFDQEISLGEEDDHPLLFSVDLEELKQDVDSFIQAVNNMKKIYIHELHNIPSPQEDQKDKFVFSSIYESKMVGLSDQFKKVKDWLTNKLPRGRTPRHLKRTLALFGTAGIGKTALAMKLFHDPSISSRFGRRFFVTVGPKYHLKDVLLDILHQVNPNHIDEILMLMDENKMISALKGMIHTGLDDDRRYLIVLDDVWDKDVWYNLINHFPDDSRGSRILMTTRLREVAHSANPEVDCGVRFLDKKESWDLFREKVFGEESCSYELEKAGKKIVEKCEGLPLTIIIVADILSKADKTPEYWNKVAAEKQNSVFIDAYEKMYKVLYPSYNYLPQYLKAYFLYMGVFPQNYEIPYSMLVNLWSAEGFLSYEHVTSNEYFAVQHLFDSFSRSLFTWNVTSEEYFAVKCLFELFSRSLLVIHKQSYSNGMKTFSLHSPFWYLCNKEARNSKFFHGLNTMADGLAEEAIKGQRRLCIRNNVLFAIKDVYDSIAATSMVRSLLCTGPHHPYPVPICSSLRLLKILDALSIRFYEFSMEVVYLVQLTYLALTFNGNLPASISNLWNLEYLIVNRHLSIVGCGGNYSSYLPMEIWDMKELKHLHVMGSDLPDPSCEEESLLPNLLSLLDVSPQSCTKYVFERIPNLRKLGIRIQLAIDDDDDAHDEPFCFFDHISHLHKLETLKCVIVNPKIISDIIAPPAPLSIFPSSLVKLTLSGLGYPWKEMSKISSLPNLRVLKLRCHAFCGPKWEVRREEFPKLEFLMIEDNDLLEWTYPDTMGFDALISLSLKHCYKLETIPLRVGTMVKKIELVDCKPLSPSYS